MKRDMDLVRAILLELEQHKHGNAPDNFALEGYPEEQVDYHVYLLMQAGLVEGHTADVSGSPSPIGVPHNLTWTGHEFIDNAREANIWQQAKEVMLKAGTGSFGVWQSVITDLVKKSVGL
ncbi:MAG: DUF2513 domain-containing protein [Stagnimonas sp.]|nr:DUF2513 domain-containing protein [Stagnimonas sp.]